MANDYLLKTWREIAYNQEQTQEQYNQFWGAYFVQEKEVYKDILGHPDVVVKGTVEELAKLNKSGKSINIKEYIEMLKNKKDE